MKKLSVAAILLITTLTSCKKYFYCDCTATTQTVTSPANAVTTTYSTTVTTYTVPVYVTKAKSLSQCGSLGGNSGLSDVTCGVIN